MANNWETIDLNDGKCSSQSTNDEVGKGVLDDFVHLVRPSYQHAILIVIMSRVHIRIQLRVRYLPFLVGVLLILQLLLPNKAWTILLVGVGGAWLIANRWAHSLANGLELTRERRFGWIQVGDKLQERFTLQNEGWAPAIWVAIKDHSTLPGYEVSKVKTVGERALIHWFTSGQCQRRGLFTLGPTSLETGDPFGFYRVTFDYPGMSTMMVMPPIVTLPAIDIAAAVRAGEGRRISDSTPEQSVNASSVREYARGDSLNRIHWPTTARRIDLFVRVFDRTPSSDWWIFLDLYQHVQVGKGLQATDEYGIVLAASLAAQGLEQGKAVGLAAAGEGQNTIWLPPKLSDDHRWQLLRELALISPGNRPLTQLLASAGTGLKARSSMIIITPDVTGQWIDPLLLLVRRGIVPTILLLDPHRFGGQSRAERILGQLVEFGIQHDRLTPDFLDKHELLPGQIGKWRRTIQGQWEPKFDKNALQWRGLT